MSLRFYGQSRSVLKLRDPLKSEIASVTIWEQDAAKQSASFLLPGGSAHIYHRAEDVDPAIWRAAFGDSHKDFEYYRLIEETMTADFAYRYLVLFDREGNPVALQPLILVEQDLAASARAAIARIIAFIRSWQPRFLRGLMLMAGCLVGDTARSNCTSRCARRRNAPCCCASHVRAFSK